MSCNTQVSIADNSFMVKKIQVSAAVLFFIDINNERRICLAQRPKTVDHPDYWEFPGGKIEIGENHIKALYREILEELNIPIQNPQLMHSCTVLHSDISIEIEFYKAECNSAPIFSNAHQKVLWLTKPELFDFYSDFTHNQILEADLPVIRMILNEQENTTS